MENKVRLIAELGSTHQGKLERIKEAVDKCKDLGIDALKLQLFPDIPPYTPTNVFLPSAYFTEAFHYAKEKGVVLSASCFAPGYFYQLLALKPQFIKLAYSKKNETEWIQKTIESGIEAIVSCDVMTDHLVPDGATKLYCIPEYPVRYEVAFDGLFPRFDGFSDHTLGTRQTIRAIEAGAKVIEKHVRLGYEDETCPDARFAVTFEEFAKVRG
jgi:N-acetylneuraminate synthase